MGRFLDTAYEKLCPERQAIFRPEYLKAHDVLERLTKENIERIGSEVALGCICEAFHFEFKDQFVELILERARQILGEDACRKLESNDIVRIEFLFQSGKSFEEIVAHFTEHKT